MRKLLFRLGQLPNPLMIGVIKLYQWTLSPDHGLMRHVFRYGVCRHSPTCSEYAVQQFKTRTFPVAFWKSTKRIISCNPWTKTSDERLQEVISKL